MANQRIMTGFINKGGERMSGTGDYTVVKGGTGLFNVVFAPAFATVPIVVTTLVYPNNIASSGGTPRDNSVLVGITERQFRVKTGDGNGNAWDCDFTFVAVGVGLDGEALAEWEAQESERREAEDES